jgi:phosphoglycerate dehydrogenase-like enzyme
VKKGLKMPSGLPGARSDAGGAEWLTVTSPRVLLCRTAYERIAPHLLAREIRIHPVLVLENGSLVSDGAAVSAEEAAVEAGWISPDVFAGPTRAFMVALLKSPVLRWVQSGAAGFDDPVFARFAAKGARLTTNSTQAPAIAEYVLANVLDEFQRGPERRQAQAAAEWARLPFREIGGSTWVVLGFGAIGQAVGALARAFGARVIGVRRTAAAHSAADEIADPSRLHEVLPVADVVVLAAPLTSQTASMVDRMFLAAMKPESVLINVGRGGLIDERALLEALDRGRPQRAVLDVFRQEPLPPESPFWRHPAVTVTPHLAAAGSGRATRGDALFVENLQRFLRDEPLLNEARPEDVLGSSSG